MAQNVIAVKEFGSAAEPLYPPGTNALGELIKLAIESGEIPEVTPAMARQIFYAMRPSWQVSFGRSIGVEVRWQSKKRRNGKWQ
jgi:hypothetical protein